VAHIIINTAIFRHADGKKQRHSIIDKLKFEENKKKENWGSFFWWQIV